MPEQALRSASDPRHYLGLSETLAMDMVARARSIAGAP
jgi:hypothetical protein